jgi:membrane protein
MFTAFASTLIETAKRWWSHDPGRLGAALAYYTIFSIGPLLLIVIAIAGLVLGRQAVEGQIVGSLSGMMGPAAANAIQGTLAGASDFGTGVLTLVIGVATLLASAIAIVMQLKTSLNIVWGVDDKPEQGYWPIIRHYILALLGVLAAGFFVMLSLMATTLLSRVGGLVGQYVSLPLAALIDLGISLSILTALFAAMFKFLPDTPVAWSDVWVGAVVTAILFLIGKWAIGWWIGRQGLDSTYGAAASVVVLLVWVYYASQILFFGAQFTRVWADRRGSRQAETAAVPAKA